MPDLVEAAESGNKRETLIALRDEIARQISESSSGRDVAALSKRLMDVLDALESMPDEGETLSCLRLAQLSEKHRGDNHLSRSKPV